MRESSSQKASVPNADKPSRRSAGATSKGHAADRPGIDKGEAFPDFRRLFESAPGAFLVLNPEFTIVAVSDAYLTATKTKREDIIGHGLFEVFPDNPADLHATGVCNLKASLDRVLQTRAADMMPTQKYDIRCPDKEDGGFEEHYWNPVNSPVLGTDGKIAYIIHSVEDVTEFIRIMEAKEAASYLSAIVESSDDAIFSETLDGIIKTWNKAAERIFGHRAGDTIGKSVSRLIPTGTAGEEDAILTRIRRGEHIEHHETTRLRKDGSRVDVSLAVSPIKDARGRIIGVSTIARDITEHNRTEKTTAQLRLVVESAPNGMVMVDEAGVIMMVNAQMERLFGYDRAELLGQPIEMLLPERYRGAHPGQRKGFFLAPEAREMGHGRDLFARRKDGSEFPVEIGLNPAKTSEGTFVLAAVIDITERKRMEVELARAHADLRHHADNLEAAVRERTAKLEEAISDLETFSYTVSHDLRSPLRTMQGFAHLVLTDYGDKLDVQARDYLQRIDRAAERMDLLIMEVLAYSRVGRAAVENEQINLEQLVDEIISHHRSFQSPAADIEIIRPLAPVLGNRITLEQAVLQLLLNAAKFVPADSRPRITISTEKMNSTVRLLIRDQGIGIPENALRHVFKPFHRAHPEAGYPGTGMGLAIVKRAVERQGGSVGVHSTSGDGSVFSIELPSASKPHQESTA